MVREEGVVGGEAGAVAAAEPVHTGTKMSTIMDVTTDITTNITIEPGIQCVKENVAMELRSLSTELEHQKIVELPPEDLPDLLAASAVLNEDDTQFAGFIRILSLESTILVQEQLPDDGKLLLRSFADRKSAEDFVRERLDTYDRMWDGCGCKVMYFE